VSEGYYFLVDGSKAEKEMGWPGVEYFVSLESLRVEAGMRVVGMVLELSTGDNVMLDHQDTWKDGQVDLWWL